MPVNWNGETLSTFAECIKIGTSSQKYVEIDLTLVIKEEYEDNTSFWTKCHIFVINNDNRLCLIE